MKIHEKLMLMILSTTLLVTPGFAQSTKNFINTNDRSALIDPLPQKPEKISKVILDTKTKGVLKEKNAIVTNHKITFYTTAYYKYSEKGHAGKVGQKVGFALTGISDETFQEITDVTNQYLVDKLKKQGYTIDDYNNFTLAKKYTKLKEKAAVSGDEYETQNLYLVKGVKAKTFTAGNQLTYPPIVGNTLHFGLVKEVKSTLIVSSFKLNFLSIGHEVSNSSNATQYITNYGIDVQECLYGSANLEFLTPKLKYGSYANKNLYRHGTLLNYTDTGETTEEGFNIIRADEEQYKKYAIQYVNNYFDLMFRYMSEIENK